MQQQSGWDEPADLTRHLLALSEAVEGGSLPPTGRLLGLPELPHNDCWVDIAGASALTGVRPKTITSWLSRRGPKRNPFPRPHRLLYRLYWPHSVIHAWQEREGRPSSFVPHEF